MGRRPLPHEASCHPVAGFETDVVHHRDQRHGKEKKDGDDEKNLVEGGHARMPHDDSIQQFQGHVLRGRRSAPWYARWEETVPSSSVAASLYSVTCRISMLLQPSSPRVSRVPLRAIPMLPQACLTTL